MNRGVLGFPRASSKLPLVRSELFNQNSKDKNKDIVKEVAKENNIDFDDASEKEIELLIIESVNKIYPEDNKVNKAKRGRVVNCAANKWANNWMTGLMKSTDLVLNDVEKAGMILNACLALTENHTPDDGRLVGKPKP